MFYARPNYMKRNVKYLYGLEDVEFIIFDFETTGLDVAHDLPVQAAMLKCRIKNGEAEKIGSYVTYIRQPKEVGRKAAEKNHITKELLQDAPEEEDVFRDIYAFIGERPILCGYNIVELDVPILERMYQRYGKTLAPVAMIDVSEMGAHDLFHLCQTGKFYIMKNAAAQEGVRQFFLRV